MSGKYTIWIEVDEKKKVTKPVIYYFEPKDKPVVQVELKKGETIEFGLPVEKDKETGKYRIKKGGK